MVAACLHARAGNGPHLCGAVDFIPTRAEDFPCAASAQDAELKRQRRDRLTLTQSCHERRHLTEGHRRMMPARERAGLREKVIQMATPAGRIFTRSQSLGSCGIKHALKARAQSARAHAKP